MVQNNTLEELTALRQEIDKTDEAIWNLFHKRMLLCQEIGILKHSADIPIFQQARHDEMLEHRLAWAKQNDMSENSVRLLFEAIHKASVEIQEQTNNNG